MGEDSLLSGFSEDLISMVLSSLFCVVKASIISWNQNPSVYMDIKFVKVMFRIFQKFHYFSVLNWNKRFWYHVKSVLIAITDEMEWCKITFQTFWELFIHKTFFPPFSLSLFGDWDGEREREWFFCDTVALTCELWSSLCRVSTSWAWAS